MLAVVSFIVAMTASAQDAPSSDESDAAAVTTSFTDDLDYRYWKRTERLPAPFANETGIFNYVEQVNRFTGLVASGPWQGFVQVDEVSLWANRYKIDGEVFTERALREPDVFWPLPGIDGYANLEKVFLARESKLATVTLGDFYGAFGNGLALNINRNVDIDIDTSIQGAKVFMRPGAWDIQLLAGQVNRQQVFQENPNLGLQGDFRHLVAGAAVTRYGLGPANVGAHGVVYHFATESGPWGIAERSVPDAVVAGSTLEVSIAGMDWIGEGDIYSYTNNADGGSLLFAGEPSDPGYAAYLSGTAYVGSTTWQFEGKRYIQTERPNALLASELYEIAIGPTLEYERAITEDSSAAVNSNNSWGGKVRMDWAAVPGEVVPYVSVAVFRDLEEGGLHFNEVPETIFHPMIGIEARPEKFSFIGNLGMRYDDRDGQGTDSERGIDADRQLHGDLDFKFALPGGLRADIAVAGEWYQWGQNPFQQEDYVEFETSYTVAIPGEKVFVVYYMDYTTNPLVNSVGNLDGDSLYGAGELQYKVSDAVTMKGFLGAYKAGIRCSGGQCRLLPGFDGARFSMTANF